MKYLRIPLLPVFLLFVLTSTYVSAQSSMPGTNCKMATAEDVAAGAIAGRVVCDADRKVFGDSGKAKLELEKMWCGGRPARCGSHIGSMTQLDPKFATCAAKFLTAMKARYPSLCIVSAYRSTEHQACTCSKATGLCATPGRSNHQKGLALDVTTGTTVLPIEIHNAARGTGVGFPLRAKNDSGHLEPSGGECADANFKPTDNSSFAPTSNLSNMFRKALGLDQQPQQQPPPPPTQQALPQQQQPSQYFPQQSGGTTGSGSTGQSPISALSPESQKYLGVTQSSDPPKSIADQLLELAYGSTSQNQPQNTGTTVPLYLNPNDIGSVSAQNVASGSTTSPPSSNIPVGSLQPSQTFISQDLSYAPSIQQPYTPPQTGVFAVLETLKSILLRMLEILRPMGIRDALQGGEMHEHAE